MAAKPKAAPDPELEALRVRLEAAENTAEASDLNSPLTFKPMFGGIPAYLDGKPVASLSNIGLALKFAPEDQEALLALPGAKRLRYEPDSRQAKHTSSSRRKSAPTLRAWRHGCSKAPPAPRS